MTEKVHSIQKPGETMTQAVARVRKPGQTGTEAIHAISVTPPSNKPTKPGKPTVTLSDATATGLKATWGKIAHAEKYTVAISPAVTGYPKDVTVLTETFAGLTAATEYTVTVKACNTAGCSAVDSKKLTTAASDEPGDEPELPKKKKKNKKNK